jgi:transcriptional regulator with XRE-family HTH domain
MSDFGGLIKDARERLGLSPHRVAELIGRAAGSVRAWERGRTVPTDPLVVTSLAAVLAIDETELFRAAGLTPPGVAPTTTIEQQLASIAPAARAPSPATVPQPERSSVATDEHPAAEDDGSDDAEAGETPLDAIADFLQKGKEAIVDVGVPAIERLRRRPRRTNRSDRRGSSSSSPTGTHPALPSGSYPVMPTGSYMDDPEERWAYRLRTLWTAAGIGALGVLLVWAGSRTLEALGEAWDALLAGL